MSSFNDVKKITYTDNKNSIVSLKEYILIKDELAKNKYLIFKFQNNLNQELSKMTFNVMQYDGDNFMIKKSTINYEDFIVDRGESFVPKLKMEVDIFCETIEIELTYAKFERVELINGVLKPILYTHSEFISHKEEKPKPSKKEQKLLEKKRIKELKAKSKNADRRYFDVLDVTNRNKPRISAIFTVLMSLSLIVFVIVTVTLHGMRSKMFNSGNYMYEKIDDNKVAIHKYYGKEENVVIPQKYENYIVTSIGKKAFKGSNCYSLTIEAPIDIEANAFENCKNLGIINGADNIKTIGNKAFSNCSSLNSFKSQSVEFVGVRAFENCSSLASVTIPSADVDFEAFMGDDLLVELIIKDTRAERLIDTFDGSKSSLVRLTISRPVIGIGYFENMNTLKELKFNAIPNIAFGALSGTNISGHFINDSIETLDGKIIAIKINDGKITLPKSITDKDQAMKFLYDYSNSIKIIETEMEIEIDYYDLLVFENLTGFGVLNNGLVDRSIIRRNNNITSIYWDSTRRINNVIDLPNTINSIYVGNYSNKEISITNQLYDLSSYEISYLKLGNVKSVSSNAFKNLAYLEELEMPNFGAFSLDALGVKQTLNSLKILNKEGNTTLTCTIDSYTDLNELILPSNITTLNASINNCMSLTNINIPFTVKSIGKNFINNCGVKTILLGDNKIETIDNYFITNCSELESIVLPSTLKTIGNRFISGCNSISFIELPNGLEKIGSYLIDDCSNVYSINVPKSVSSIATPLIGSNCNISYMATPFVGTSAERTVNYNVFNRSANQLNYLRVYGNLNLTSSFCNGLTNLYTLIVDGKTTGLNENVFSQLTNLARIRINGELNSKFNALFSGKTNMDSVVIDTTSSITDSFFNGMNINSVAINSYKDLSISSFNNCTISYLFIGKTGNKTTLEDARFYENTISGGVVTYLLFLDMELNPVAKLYEKVRRLTYYDYISDYSGMPEILY